MTAAELVAAFEARGVMLIADGHLLRCRPKSALTAGDLDVLRDRKAEVLEILRAETTARAAPVVCFACKERRFWRSVHGVVICATCHPPARPELVAEWLDRPRTDGA